MSYLLKSILVILSLLILFLPECARTPGEARVIQVIDGDTIVIEGGYHVRYIGINTPEIYPEVEPYGIEAKEANKALVEGRMVQLERDVTEKDDSRLLRYVYVDSLFVNVELVRQGYAEVYPKDRYPDNKYYDLLKEAEEEAREVERGIWGTSP